MKQIIAYVTFHRSYNYGAALQAYATAKLIAELGYEPLLIDYCTSNLRDYGTIRSLFNDSGNRSDALPIRFMKSVVKSIGNKKRKKAFDSFIDNEIPLTRTYYSCDELSQDPPKADIYCTGSDQVWNNYYTNELDPTFFLQFAPKTAKRISIAASFGKSDFDEPDIQRIKQYVSSYDYLSVREVEGVHILERCGFSDIDLMLDPTLLRPHDEWVHFADEIRSLEPGFVLVYQLHGESETARLAVEYAQKTGKKVVSIVSMPYQKRKGCMNVVAPSVHEFVGFFKAADCVFTDSFHGTVFSLTFNKKLAATLPPRFSNRITSLLDAIDANVLVCGKLDDWLAGQQEFDYIAMQKKLQEYKDAKRMLLASRIAAL